MTLDDTLVVLDTCVLLRPRLSDVLMDLRAQGLFSAHWTAEIDDEFIRNMQCVYGVDESLVLRRLSAMKRRCPEWHVEMASADFRAVPPGVDAKDRHVAAAALALRRYSRTSSDVQGPAEGQVTVVVLTDNDRHMARPQLKALGVEVLRPGAFLNSLFAAAPDAVMRALAQTQKDLRHPPYTLAELLDVLYKAGARSMVGQLEAALKLRRQPKASMRRAGM